MRHRIVALLVFCLLTVEAAWAQKDLARLTGLPPQREDTLTLYIVGDIMSHGAQTRSAFRSGRANYSTFFRHLESRIREADVAIGNLEFPLAGKPYTGYPAFSGPDEYASYLDSLGFDVLLTANNHILDRGSEGLARTLDRLDSLSLFHTGAARTDSLRHPLLLQVKGVTLAVVNLTYGTNLGPTRKSPVVFGLSDWQPLLQEAAASADIVLVLPHWGLEYHSVHAPEQEALAREMAAAGAHLIVGTHPHVVQDFDKLSGTPVFYSLGNAVSNQNDLPARLELGLRIRIVHRFGASPFLLDALPEYLWCTKPGMLEDSYAVIPVRDFLDRQDAWRVPADYYRMVCTYQAVQAATGLPDHELITFPPY